MSYLIYDADCASTFNEDLNAWDVSQVTTFEGMFEAAEAFNQPLNGWDVSKATDTYAMFFEA